VIHKGLDVQGLKPGEGKGSVPVHNDPGARTSSYSMDIKSLLGLKLPGCGIDHPLI